MPKPYITAGDSTRSYEFCAEELHEKVQILNKAQAHEKTSVLINTDVSLDYSAIEEKLCDTEQGKSKPNSASWLQSSPAEVIAIDIAPFNRE